MKDSQMIRFVSSAMIIAVFLALLFLPAWGVSALRLAGEQFIYLPVAMKSEATATPTPSPTVSPTPFTCEIAGQSYEKIPIKGDLDDRPDVEHADLNLALRGYEEVDEFKGLIKYGGDTDPQAPQLAGLFEDGRTPIFRSTYAVYDWDWSSNQRGDLLDRWPVTLAGLLTTPGEMIHVPDREGGDIYQGDFKVVVIYADEDSITLKYTRDDDVVYGYTIHVDNVCVEPDLVALYREGDDNDRRRHLPALAHGQPFGRAKGEEIRVAIRDVGSFMDPRSRKDWWVDHALTTPSATPTASVTPSATPQPATSTPTPSKTATPTRTVTPSATASATSSMTPSVSTTATSSMTPSATASATSSMTPSATPTPSVTATSTATPLPPNAACAISGVSYEKIPIKGAPSSEIDDEAHGDLNLALRGYEETSEFAGLVDYTGDTDSQAPQLAGLFADSRTPIFVDSYQVHHWDWDNNQPGPLISDWPVTLSTLQSSSQETLHLPDREGGDIYQGRFKALVIYASENRITIKYTREDNVVQGYTIHVENVCVEPTLLQLYRQADQAGRLEMPALAPAQPFGRANSTEIGVVIRDVGSFMDPRSRKDWWRGH